MVDTYCSMMSLVAAPAPALCVTLPRLHPSRLLYNTPSAPAAGDADDNDTNLMHQIKPVNTLTTYTS